MILLVCASIISPCWLGHRISSVAVVEGNPTEGEGFGRNVEDSLVSYFSTCYFIHSLEVKVAGAYASDEKRI